MEWPAIKDTVLIQFIMSVGNIMSVGFEKAYALQTDLNLNASEIISTYVYKKVCWTATTASPPPWVCLIPSSMLCFLSP